MIHGDKQASKHGKGKRQSWDPVQTPSTSWGMLDGVLCLSEPVSSPKIR